MINKLLLVAGLAAMLGKAIAAEGPEFKFSGYGTVGATASNTDEAQYRSSTNQDKGAGKSPDFGVDSRLGMQLSATFGEAFSGVAQVLANRANGEEKLRLEWLYAQAKPADWLEVRLGRMVLPVFLQSDSRNVGYAAHFIRTPQEVYGQYPLSSFDGGQAQLRGALGDVNLTAQLSLGKSEGKIGGPPLLTWNNDKIRSVNFIVEVSDWTLRYGRTQGRTTITGLPFPTVPTNETFSGLGLQYDNGTLLVVSEMVTRRQVTKGGDADAWYVSAGWRFGPIMPYLTHAVMRPKGLFFPSTANTGTDAIGLRWDAMRNIALKAQVEQTDSGPSMINVTPAFMASGNKLKAFSLAADFVF